MKAPVIEWSSWSPLPGASVNREIPRSPGLYRIRRVGHLDLDYIGQTGRGLRQRLAGLRGVYDEQMPYRDPHTAAPALWALRHAGGCDFEVSTAAIDGSTHWRKGMEALAIAEYRAVHGASPTIEFGRMLPGYRPSSPNNAVLVKLGKRVRGGACEDSNLPCHAVGVPPAGPLIGSPQSSEWNNHHWSEWMSREDLKLAKLRGGAGLYRIRGDEQDSLLYIGQGIVPGRPLAHIAKIGMPWRPQGVIFGSASRLECSWVLNGEWLPHHRLELKNDLIAAHMIATGDVPRAQFRG